ncbi:MAG: hypothetical protein HOV94_42830 [Saccharothrix sp.]|nr:hypothetical protein [Saccharothrix sp.]
MTDLDRRKRPGVVLASLLVPFAVLATLYTAYLRDSFASLGWHGGEYAYAFIGVAVGSIVLGLVLKFLRPPWDSVGTGLLIGGTVGVLAAIAVFVLFMIALSQWGPTF